MKEFEFLYLGRGNRLMLALHNCNGYPLLRGQEIERKSDEEEEGRS